MPLKATKNVSLTKMTPNDQANLLGSAFQAGAFFSSIFYLLSMGIDDCSEVKFEDFYKSKRPPRANVEQYKQFWQVCRKIYWPIAGMRIKKDLKLAIVLSPIFRGLDLFNCNVDLSSYCDEYSSCIFKCDSCYI